MKIALINTSLRLARGSDLVVHQLALALSAKHEVTVFAPFGADAQAAPYRLVARPSSLSSIRGWLASLRQLWALRRAALSFDVLNCHHALLSLLLPADRLITTYHGYRGRLHFIFGRRIAERLSELIRTRLIARALCRSRRVTLVSDSMRAEIERIGLAEPAVVIHNGVEFDRTRTDPQSSGLGSYFIYLGRLDPDKSVDRLLELYVSSNVDVPLWIAGDGAERARLQRAFSKYAHIRFVGSKKRDEIPDLLCGAIAFLTASTYETFCLPVIEAAAFGRPAIGPRSGSLPEVIRSGETGYLYASEDEFRSAIVAILSASRIETQRMADSCRAWAATFDWSKQCRDYESVYAEVALPAKRSQLQKQHGSTSGIPEEVSRQRGNES